MEIRIFMKDYSKKVKDIRNSIDEADYVLIGAGAGLSSAAGIEYGGKRFEENFQYYIKKYNMTDMYTAGFYPFESLEENINLPSKLTRIPLFILGNLENRCSSNTNQQNKHYP